MVKNKEKSIQNASKERRERCSPLLAVPEDESDINTHSLPRLSVVLPSSQNSSTENVSRTKLHPLNHGDESMTVVLSAFYAKLLIVLGLALPVTSTIQNEYYTNITSDVFSMYLYVVSMIFLAYTFYHLKIATKDKSVNLKRSRYGSFYLHIGVAGFGVGSIIHSCLQFAVYFDLSGDCQHMIIALKPALHIFYMVTQIIFIFSYTDILDPMRGVVLDRFGLMHLIATNVCEWLNVIIQDTRDDIIFVAYKRPPPLKYANLKGPSEVSLYKQLNNNSYTNNDTILVDENFTLENYSWSCNVSNMITPLIRSVNPYLRPCGVEYSLLCSVIIVVIWNDICTVPGSKSKETVTTDVQPCCARVKSNNHFSVDCSSAHRGLFMGIAVISATVVSLMLFTGLFQNKQHEELALLQINIWETVLFIMMTLGSGACIHRMRFLKLKHALPTMPLEHALLLVTQCGVYLYYLFQVIGASFINHRIPDSRKVTRIISPLCAVIQSSCQTLLIMDSWTRRTNDNRHRPGRQLVTFLLVGNYALWLLNRIKNSRAEYHPIQIEFFGVWAWTLITHISVPLLVCYRFQATVCFYELWKNCYKTHNKFNDNVVDDIELNNLPT